MSNSAVRILHTSPDTSGADVYVNGDLVVQDLSYEEITDYLMMVPGECNIKVFPTGETTNPTIDCDLVIPDGEVITLAAVGISSQIGLLPVRQTVKCPTPGQAMIRFIHLSPDAPPVNVTLSDDTQLITQVGYQETTEYLAVQPGTYYLRMSPSGLDTVMLEVPEVHLKAEQLYSIYALGRLEGQPDLKAKVVTDTTKYCVREAVAPPRVSAPPPEPDVRPYHWDRVQIKLHYR